jgi:hypothetical protein
MVKVAKGVTGMVKVAKGVSLSAAAPGAIATLDVDYKPPVSGVVPWDTPRQTEGDAGKEARDGAGGGGGGGGGSVAAGVHAAAEAEMDKLAVRRVFRDNTFCDNTFCDNTFCDNTFCDNTFRFAPRAMPCFCV